MTNLLKLIYILGRMFYYEVILQGVAKLAYSEFGA
jgi:hypothetical protein